MLAALPNAGPSMVEVVLPRLINELALLETPVVLVLDDYHLLQRRAPARLGRVPRCATCRGRCGSRSPAAPTLRCRSRVCGPPASSWRSARRSCSSPTPRPTQLLNGTLELDLEAADVQRLQERTEGWPAGLQLAALSLRGPQRPRRVHPLAGRRRPPDRRLPARGGRGRAPPAAGVPAAHVDPRAHVRAVVRRGHRPGGQRRAARRGVPVEPVRRRARRPRATGSATTTCCATCCSASSRAPSRTSCPSCTPARRRGTRAGGSVDEAIDHAVAAGRVEDAAELIAAHWLEAWDLNPGTVARWLQALPPGAIEADGRLGLVRGWAALFTGRLDDVEPAIAGAERAPRPGPPVDVLGTFETKSSFLRAAHLYLRGDVTRAHALAVKARRRRRTDVGRPGEHADRAHRATSAATRRGRWNRSSTPARRCRASASCRRC